MADLTAWNVSISSADLMDAPLDPNAPNAIDSASKRTVALSVSTPASGPGAHVEVHVFFWNTVTEAFSPTGDVYTLRPSTENIALLSPAGLVLGFSAQGHGLGGSDFTLHVGLR